MFFIVRTRHVRDAGPVGQPHGGAHAAGLGQDEPRRQQQERGPPAHGLHVRGDHPQRHVACTADTPVSDTSEAVKTLL